MSARELPVSQKYPMTAQITAGATPPVQYDPAGQFEPAAAVLPGGQYEPATAVQFPEQAEDCMLPTAP